MGVASAILALCDPESYAPIDFRVWRQLFGVDLAMFDLARVPPLHGAPPRACRRAAAASTLQVWLDRAARRLLLLGARQGARAT